MLSFSLEGWNDPENTGSFYHPGEDYKKAIAFPLRESTGTG